MWHLSGQWVLKENPQGGFWKRCLCYDQKPQIKIWHLFPMVQVRFEAWNWGSYCESARGAMCTHWGWQSRKMEGAWVLVMWPSPRINELWSCPSSGLLLWFNLLCVRVSVVCSHQIPKWYTSHVGAHQLEGDTNVTRPLPSQGCCWGGSVASSQAESRTYCAILRKPLHLSGPVNSAEKWRWYVYLLHNITVWMKCTLTT